MKKIIKPSEIEAKKPFYQITDDDIDYINEKISKMFLEEWNQNPDTKKVMISSYNTSLMCHDIEDAIMELTGWTRLKTYALKTEFMNLIKEAGYEIVLRGINYYSLRIIKKC